MEKIIFIFALLLSTIFLAMSTRKVGDYDYGHDSYIRMLEAIEKARARVEQELDQKEVNIFYYKIISIKTFEVLMSVPES